jgi:hypothetical protein
VYVDSSGQGLILATTNNYKAVQLIEILKVHGDSAKVYILSEAPLDD